MWGRRVKGRDDESAAHNDGSIALDDGSTTRDDGSVERDDGYGSLKKSGDDKYATPDDMYKVG